ncbi:MAG: Glycerol-3-phosphate responsive antiterminator [Firmicutes bacterium ADurb.Bin182]|nr:MAG: Glycerol-3-phosphate responsive antiterminator [Firmicutes bacterium ADurb.Bin182]
MKHEEFVELLKENRIIAAVKDEDGLKRILTSNCQIVFVLFGDIVILPDILFKIKGSGKTVFVHIDLVDGLAARDVSVDYIAQNTCADGIISTRPNIIKRAKDNGLLAVQRFFVLDSIAFNNIEKQISQTVDAIEILPGVMPKIIKRLSNSVKKPIIAGGLISDREDIVNALNAGAFAVSLSKWDV